MKTLWKLTFALLPEAAGRSLLVAALEVAWSGRRPKAFGHVAKRAFVARWGWDAADSAYNLWVDCYRGGVYPGEEGGEYQCPTKAR